MDILTRFCEWDRLDELRFVAVFPLSEPFFHAIRAGDKVQATVAQELAIYVAKNGQVPGSGGKLETIEADARVLQVDPSYRLLTLQYPNGQTETFKVGLDVKLLEMEPGDVVVVRNTELITLRADKT